MPTFTIARDAAQSIACDVLAVPVYKGLALGPGAKEILAALGTSLDVLSEQVPVLAKPDKQFTGELGQAILVSTLGAVPATQVLFIGMGEKGEATTWTARRAGAMTARRVGGARTVATTVAQAVRGSADDAVAAYVEGFILGSYRYLRYKASQNGRPNRVESVQLVAGKSWDARRIKAAIERAQIMADATYLARDLTNTPSFDKSPESLAETARGLSKLGLKVAVMDEKELAKRGFGGILGVGRGSAKPPRLVEIRYEGTGAKQTIALIGKGITFDSGGINLKPGEGMDWMKMDMGGAAAVLGAMQAVARLKPRGINVRGYIATAENMPDGNALRPGDVITQYGGKTVEIGNTDAEGRLVMADALVYAREQGADVVIDVATLTGACMVALGHKVFGVIGEPRSEVKKVLDAAGRAGEAAWELPLHKEYAAVMESDIADLRNIPSRNVGGGAITAALFLKQFAGDTPWVHLDIAGPSKSDEDDFERSKWATGVGVRTLVEYVLAR